MRHKLQEQQTFKYTASCKLFVTKIYNFVFFATIFTFIRYSDTAILATTSCCLGDTDSVTAKNCIHGCFALLKDGM